MKKFNRRDFLIYSAAIGAGFAGLKAYSELSGAPSRRDTSYGPLLKDPRKLLNLPEGFTYRVFSSRGETMNDGLPVPGAHDGTASFKGKNAGDVILIRNHELGHLSSDDGSVGLGNNLLNKVRPELFYDFGKGETPALGGTTTVVYNENSGQVKYHYMSLFGTIRNCAGGVTPWKSWITCEETTEILDRKHGYNFEVLPSGDGMVRIPRPLTEMGRFRHEAVAVDPKTGIVYQTEDEHEGLIYRFLPNEYGRLEKGGRLQALAIKDMKGCDTRNWDQATVALNTKMEVEWLDLEGIDSDSDDLRFRGHQSGAAIFARGEGAWFGNNEFYFACTNGGKNKTGQVFRYTPGKHEGRQNESTDPGHLELFAEPNDSEIMKSCDNLTVAPWGDVLLVEDDPHPFIVGITPRGEFYKLAENVGHSSELAGINFSPSGKTLFVNIQNPGLSIAIQGPW